MHFLLRWFTRNWADTDEPGDPAVRPVDLAMPVGQAIQHIQQVIERLPRWRVESVEEAAGTIRATRRTRLGFVDDITIRLEATATGCRVHARSQARLGKGDLGQNRRNLVELIGALRC